MADLSALQAADVALQQEVSTALADFAAQIGNAGTDQGAIDSVVSDMNAMAEQLRTADTTQTPPAEPTA